MMQPFHVLIGILAQLPMSVLYCFLPHYLHRAKHKKEIKVAKDKTLMKHSFISEDLVSNLAQSSDAPTRKKVLNSKLDELQKHAFSDVQQKMEKKRQGDFCSSRETDDDDDEVYIHPTKRAKIERSHHEVPVEDLKPEDVPAAEEWCHQQVEKYNLQLAMLELKKKSIKSVPTNTYVTTTKEPETTTTEDTM